MKKKISAMLLALLMAFTLCTPAWASNGIMNYIIDAEDVLDYDEWDALEDRAAEISQRHNCGVYVYFTEDYTYYGDGSAYDVARLLYSHPDAPLGLGEDMVGILLLVSLSERDWALYVYGDQAVYAFGNDPQDGLSDEFLPYFADDDWVGGFSAYLTTCDEYLTRAEQGDPVHGDNNTPVTDNTQGDDAQASPVKGVLTAVGISCLIALLICLVLKGKMKSVHRKSEARNYTTNGGLRLTEKYDHYTHTTESVRHIEKSSGDGGGGGGSSGSSGKF